ncbi:MAG: SgcJ/EcaC family oxidoreductase [Bacteroidota bacterium]
MKYTFALLGFILLGFSSQAQTKYADVTAIEKQVDAMVNSWNKHDYSDMKTYATEDCSWVNIVGMVWKNRKEVEYAHQFYHTNMFKHTTMTIKGVSVRILNASTALVHFKSYVSEFTTPSGQKMPGSDDMALLVFVKEKGKWLLTAGENVVVDPLAQKHDPVLHMNK